MALAFARQDEAASAAPVAIPGYEILGELGRGGMGVVYQARQTKLNRLVALKMVLVGGHAGPADLARFQTEAEAIARLQHPNIVQVHEVGEWRAEGVSPPIPYFSLEYCDGGSLEKKLNSTPLPAHEAAALVQTLAAAMQAAHEHHVVHRDLKPANVLLTATGTPKITDFGLAKKLDEAGQTQAGAVMGTPSYMAPEQADAKFGSIGPATDVYALGAILYECLTGRPPFKAATALDTILQVIADEPVPPSQLQSKTPRDLETICLKCLEKDSLRRYASAGELADDLGRWQRGEPVRARPPSLGYVLGKSVRRYRVPLAVAAAVFLTAVIGVGAYVVQINAALDRETKAKDDAKTALADLEARQSQLARSFCEVSDREFSNGNVRDSVNWMLRAYEVAPKDDPLRWSYRHLLAAQSQFLDRPLVLDGAVMPVAFSPDNRTVLTSGSEGKTARLWDAATGKPIGQPMLHKDFVVDALAFSPDGHAVLTAGRDYTARLWDAATGKPLGEPLRHKTFVLAVAFSPDGCRVLTGSSDNTARLWDVGTSKQQGEPMHHRGQVLAVAFSPDGRTVLTGSVDHTARLWDAATGQQVGESMLHQGQVEAVAFSPDGRTVLTGSFDMTARLWDAATGKPRSEPLRHQSQVRAAAFSPDGRTVLTASNDKTAQLWDATTGKPLGEALQHQDKVNTVAFSPDGRTVLTGSVNRTARLWDVATAKPLGEPMRHHGQVRTVAFSPDGRTVLTGGYDNAARLWEVVAPAPDDLPWLRAWAQARTGKAFDAKGVLRQLSQAEWLQACRELEALGGDWAPKPSGRCWHLAHAVRDNFHLKWLLIDNADNAAVPPDAWRLVELAELHHQIAPDKTASQEILGAALVRAGRYAEAVKQLDDVAAKPKAGDTVRTQLFLALAHHHLGDDAKAKDFLQKADEQTKKTEEDKDAPPDWPQRLRNQTLRQEVEAVLKSHP